MQISRNPYWEMAKVAFIFGVAGAAGSLAVSTGARLIKKSVEWLDKNRAEYTPPSTEEENTKE